MGTSRYFLSLGSNLGDRENNLKMAVEFLSAEGIRIVSASSLYETEPVGITTEAWFFNQVLEVETRLNPEALLHLLKRIEEQLGRVHTECPKSRPIDIDILLAGEKTVNSRDLKIPHSRMTERNFVLIPLAEIAPDAQHPVLKKKIKDLLEKSKDRSRVKKL
ncbi:MAG: 2-amino-4-hydroxy-6-hydroxymethyldihydropteridine diphosphokinase [Candidatus Aminicenantes bacterium]|jgi:2-amino-4-hydroxy-6-hydroxymethyldihydropteridine diphosphokinase